MTRTPRRPPPPTRDNWWVWLLAALAVVAVLGLLYEGFSGDDDTVDPTPDGRTPTATVTTTATAASETSAPADPDAITSLSALTDPEQPDELVGRQARLDRAPVHAVAADRVFWVGPSQGRRLMVVLPANADRGTAERLVDVNEGQEVDVSGTVRKLPSERDELRREFDLGTLDLLTLAGEQIYVQADQLEIHR